MAALTMPSLITKHQKMVFAAKAKQTYSILSNALITSVAENGPMSEWNYGQSYEAGSGYDKTNDVTYIVNTYFKPYLKVAEDIGFKNSGYHILLSNGTTLSFYTDGGTDEQGIRTFSAIYIVSSDNGNISPYNNYGTRDYSKHDIIFKLHISSKCLLPFAFGKSFSKYENIDNRDSLINHDSYGCNKKIDKKNRLNCGALLMYDNWEIKDDYPW